MADERGQRSLDPVRPYELRQVTALTPGQVEQLAIGTAGVRVHGSIDEVQEVGFAPREALTNDGDRPLGAQGMPEVRREPPEKAAGDPKIGDRDPGAQGNGR